MYSIALFLLIVLAFAAFKCVRGNRPPRECRVVVAPKKKEEAPPLRLQEESSTPKRTLAPAPGPRLLNCIQLGCVTSPLTGASPFTWCLHQLKQVLDSSTGFISLTAPTVTEDQVEIRRDIIIFNAHANHRRWGWELRQAFEAEPIEDPEEGTYVPNEKLYEWSHNGLALWPQVKTCDNPDAVGTLDELLQAEAEAGVAGRAEFLAKVFDTVQEHQRKYQSPTSLIESASEEVVESEDPQTTTMTGRAAVEAPSWCCSKANHSVPISAPGASYITDVAT